MFIQEKTTKIWHHHGTPAKATAPKCHPKERMSKFSPKASLQNSLAESSRNAHGSEQRTSAL